MLKVEFNSDGLLAKLDALTGRASEAVRPAAQAGAEVLYREARAIAPRSEKAHFSNRGQSAKTGGTLYTPGTLQQSIYQAFDGKTSEAGKVANYGVSWNKQKAFYGRFVEFGTSKMPAQSFIRRAWDAKKTEAIEVVKSEFADRMKGKR